MKEPWEVLEGDALARLAELEAGAFHCAVCSPPYWKLRSYLHKDHPSKYLELGQEDSPDCFAWARGEPGACDACFVCRMTRVFREVRRVLRGDGTLWVNVAGSYASNGQGGSQNLDKLGVRLGTGGGHSHSSPAAGVRRGSAPAGWKQKDFVNVPALLAESLRADGWYLRAEIALTKLSPMPESCRDRPTRATEKLYLFAKSARYFYDQEAERLPHTMKPQRRFVDAMTEEYREGSGRRGIGGSGVSDSPTTYGHPAGRNLWNWMDDTDDDLPEAVWPWRPEGGAKEKHYATYPLWLPLRVIRLATSARGVCPKCGAPWRRVVERKKQPRATTAALAAGALARCEGVVSGGTARSTLGVPAADGTAQTLGWAPSCSCPPADLVPARVLDCFAGLCTTGVAARLLGRTFTGVELSPDYVKIARQRLATAAPLDDAAFARQEPPAPPQPSLFAQEEDATP